MDYKIVYDLNELPISDKDLEYIESMPYIFGYACMYKTYAAIKTENDYCYAIVHFDCKVIFND